MYNKKGFVELTSFVLLTLLVVITSISAYVFSKGFLDEKVVEFDRNRAESYMTTMHEKVTKVQGFDDSSTSMNFEFKKGKLVFQSNQVYFQTLIDYTTTSDLCFDILCYSSTGESERIYFNLSNSYNFDENITLEPGFYKLTFTNNKTANEISVKIS